ncbi:sugar phosphate isomerase/epimerase family protein [Tenggerimyces flavus]|uniref:Sugar phosphate isomerase/epimerase family protein n=1 Tax=Tenggerimyces flavus TaxID=1708749 RepID=A0ABV7YAY5_9ACTN|nr:sugar phosphate isomerase/epimerase family protein [Tenggerimyces flavus]
MWTLSGFADEIDPAPEIQFEVLTGLGIRHVEFRSAWGTNVLDLSDEQIAEIKRLLNQYGVALSAVGSPIGKVSVADDFDEHLRRFERAIWVAHELGAPYIRIFSFYPPTKGEDPTPHRDEVLRRMSALTDRIKGDDLVLGHENDLQLYGDTPDRALDLIESVGSEQLRQVWDPANFVLSGARPFTDGFAKLRPYLAYLQIKDAVAETGQVVPAGDGDGQIAETLRALKDDGFDGFFSMEPHLARAGHAGGFSGPELFGKATHAFTGLLDEQGISYQ